MALASFLLLGAIFALLRRSTLIFFDNSVHIIKCTSFAFQKPSKAFKSVNSEFAVKKGVMRSTLFFQIFDFFFTLTMAIGYILFSYVFLDGCIRLFFALETVLSFFLFYRLTDSLEGVFFKLFHLFTVCFILICSIMLLPATVFFKLGKSK